MVYIIYYVYLPIIENFVQKYKLSVSKLTLKVMYNTQNYIEYKHNLWFSDHTQSLLYRVSFYLLHVGTH